MKRTGVAITVLAIALAGCGGGKAAQKPVDPAEATTGTLPDPGTVDVMPLSQASPSAQAGPMPGSVPQSGVPESATTTSAAHIAANGVVAIPGEMRLGTTVASLGDPTATGFWIRTPLVTAPGKGRLEDPKTGASVQVDLLPLVGDRNAGSQISLAALRLLGFAPSDLAQIVVWRS